MKHLVRNLALVTTLMFVSVAVQAKEDIVVIVVEPYVEMHTGPGRGYPVFYVAEQGSSIKIIKRRTHWFLVETDQGTRSRVGLDIKT